MSPDGSLRRLRLPRGYTGRPLHRRKQRQEPASDHRRRSEGPRGQLFPRREAHRLPLRSRRPLSDLDDRAGRERPERAHQVGRADHRSAVVPGREGHRDQQRPRQQPPLARRLRRPRAHRDDPAAVAPDVLRSPRVVARRQDARRRGDPPSGRGQRVPGRLHAGTGGNGPDGPPGTEQIGRKRRGAFLGTHFLLFLDNDLYVADLDSGQTRLVLEMAPSTAASRASGAPGRAGPATSGVRATTPTSGR